MGPPKQVILVRRDLKMPPGKLAAQVAHASMGALLKSSFNAVVPVQEEQRPCRVIPMSPPMNLWLDGAFTKVCLGVDSLEELIDYKNKAEDARILNCVIKDSGRTVFKEPTITCMALGPDYTSVIDTVTGQLKLY